MFILGIETSCDETALALIEASGSMGQNTRICALADTTHSQAQLHARYGGVFPSLAKREHARNLVPLLRGTLCEARLLRKKKAARARRERARFREIFSREPELYEDFLDFIGAVRKPPLDAIAVTVGPGLEPCLWTGINFARALALAWRISTVPINHMEGHIFSSLLRKRGESPTATYEFVKPKFPAVALLISGGHTELVLIKKGFEYEVVGKTRDDAAGEAFDKVARLLGLPYPGGPPLSRIAEKARAAGARVQSGGRRIKLPRPMLASGNLDFSFSGLKTAVLYLLREFGTLTEQKKAAIAREFEDAVSDILVAKTKMALERCDARTLIVAGGVIANTRIRCAFKDLAFTHGRRQMLNEFTAHFPEPNLTTDNALMIAAAAFVRRSLGEKSAHGPALTAQGGLTF